MLYTTHPQSDRYQNRMQTLIDHAKRLQKEGRPILKQTLVSFALTEFKVTERTAKEYANVVLAILERES